MENNITLESAKQNFLFGFIKTEMIERNSAELTREVLDAAYRKTVSFLADEEVLFKLKTIVRHKVKNGKS